MNRILLIDDDKELCALIKKSVLQENGSLTPKNYEITRKASNGFIFLSNLYFLLPRYS